MATSNAKGVTVEADQLVDLLPDHVVWRILRKYASSAPAVGSQLSPARGDTVRQDNACTVAQKLTRCPLVERVLWTQQAADWLRGTWQPAIASARIGHPPNVHAEHPALVRAVFRFKWSPRLAEAWATRAQRRAEFRWQFALVVAELSACWWHPEAGAAFRQWIEGTMLEPKEVRR
jgi:hypothetical protein